MNESEKRRKEMDELAEKSVQRKELKALLLPLVLALAIILFLKFVLPFLIQCFFWGVPSIMPEDFYVTSATVAAELDMKRQCHAVEDLSFRMESHSAKLLATCVMGEDASEEQREWAYEYLAMILSSNEFLTDYGQKLGLGEESNRWSMEDDLNPHLYTMSFTLKQEGYEPLRSGEVRFSGTVWGRGQWSHTNIEAFPDYTAVSEQ